MKFTVVIDEVVTYRFTVEAATARKAENKALKVYHNDGPAKAAALESVTNVEVVNVEATA